MKVLIFGSSGQLGTELVRTLGLDVGGAASDFVLESAPRDVDISNPELVETLVKSSCPDWIVNSAAMTDVDGAHLRPQAAMAVNASGAANIARAASLFGSRLLHISSEAVFAGDSVRAYTEEDTCRPVSVYGISKLAGEQLTIALNPMTFVIRTSWLYSDRTGSNFPTRLLQQLHRHDEPVSVVDDLFGNPTPARILSTAIGRLMATPPQFGVYHVCCSGLASKYEWALEIAAKGGFDSGRIRPVESSIFPTPALRPLRVDLACDRFEEAGLMHLPTWQEASARTLLPDVVKEG